MSLDGWIKIHRKILDCQLFKNEPYSKMQAWIYLILKANHSDREIFINGEKVTIKRGQFHTSLYKLEKEWKWSKMKVRRFLSVIEREQMVITSRSESGTTITIVNYGLYQYGDTTNDTTNDTQTRIIKNEKNVKNNNKSAVDQQIESDFEIIYGI